MFSFLSTLNPWTWGSASAQAQGQHQSDPQSPSNGLPFTMSIIPAPQLNYSSKPTSLNARWKGGPSPPPTSVLHTPVTASPPMLPGWNRALEKAERISTSFVQLPVDRESGEYEEIQKLFEGTAIEMTSLQRVVNPGLWHRFVRTRAHLLASKSDDIRLLAELGLSDEEIAHKIGEAALDFEGSSFSDNVMLLFYRASDSGGLEAYHEILCDGLTTRNGAFGRGIYFTDCPEKANQHGRIGALIIYAVVLGDCLEIQDDPTRSNSLTLREVMKTEIQQRNPCDRFFDSIVGRRSLPPGGTGPNEYVIFNQALCCPLYSVYYIKKAKTPKTSCTSSGDGKETIPVPAKLAAARSQLPSFAWPKSHYPTTPKSPFYAATIFKAMTMPDWPDTPTTTTTQDDKIRFQFTQLAEHGFTNMKVNERVLYLFEYDVGKAIEYLLNDEGEDMEARRLQPVKFGTTAAESEAAVEVEEECNICMTKYSATTGAAYFVTLPCSPTHKMCTTCIDQVTTTRTTMRGESHETLKCPFCRSFFGSDIQIGDSPDGIMSVRKLRRTPAGYRKNLGSIAIRYYFPPEITKGPAINLIAYLPNTAKGGAVLKLLRIAWDRRLIFRLIDTTGERSILVWNIHHKTKSTGGVTANGYPDPTYLQRVQEELAQYGIQ